MAIDPKSLRIGNMLRDGLTGELLRVCETTEGGFITTVINRDKFPLPDGWFAEPIPLSASLLERAGFEKHKDFTNWWVFENIAIKHDFGTWMVYLNSYVSSIDYYHQIQNIVYDLLKGKEL